MDLVIMAAGMGSRFGGLKQVEPVGPNGEFILDYSIYDAKKAGFNRVVFIIKEENYDLFRNTVGKRIENVIDVDYVFQDINNIPSFVDIPEDRVKPWGTAHAIYSCKDKVKNNFAIINADDFYGYDAFKTMASYLKEMNTKEYCMVGYKAKNTLTDNGSVKRGVCYIDNGYLVKLVESSIIEQNGEIIATPLNEEKGFTIQEDDYVSMNLFGFNPTLFDYLEKKLNSFFEENINQLEKCEWLIPDVVFQAINEKEAQVRVLNTKARWYGITYREDKEKFVKQINEMIKENIYPLNLWVN
ncbi:MAG: nucleotidyltransferase [Tenericutes bacterium]|jgi:NDP-sugar pyrophosphorylase family protein|nr:nucleotidyltransferase [Mycoplasmatota bacterium]